MKKILLCSVLLLQIILLSACGASDKTDNEATYVETSKSEKALGSKEKPATLNQSLTYSQKHTDIHDKKVNSTFKLSINQVIRGQKALSELKKANTHNQVPPANQEWAIFDATIAMTETTTSDTVIFFIPMFHAIDSSGYTISQENEAILADDQAFGYKDLKHNQELKGKFALLVPINEKINLQYVYAGNKLFFEFE